MLAAVSHVEKAPDSGRIADIVTACLGDVNVENVSTLAGITAISKRSLRDLQLGAQIPQLQSMLKLCYHLHLTPLSCLTVLSSSLLEYVSSTKTPLNGQTKRRKRLERRRSFDAATVGGALEELVCNEPQSPISLTVAATVAAKRLGYDSSFLSRHFPLLCSHISRRYETHIEAKRQERVSRIRTEVKEATYTVHAMGEYPGYRKVKSRLDKPRQLHEPEALSAWHTALGELGLEQASD
jgi:hypothetical protein